MDNYVKRQWKKLVGVLEPVCETLIKHENERRENTDNERR